MWTKHENHLEADFEFKDFTSAFAFMTRVAFEAEKAQHHPNWSNEFNKVNVKLSTHDEGDKITEKDEKLAETIKKIYSNWPDKA